jgi:peptide-methionine (S)-S-oxide reductase
MDSKILETATLGGGCFWCTEAVMEELEGVAEVVSGYSGGKTENPNYRQVSNGHTGHAEVVQVYFDPQVISYADLLRVFLATHNPTSFNRQGADVGTQYRSIILYHNVEQQQTAKKVLQEIQPYFDKPIITEIKPFTRFYKAEESHQNYYHNNPDKAYCTSVINPKLQKLREQFGRALRKKGK